MATAISRKLRAVLAGGLVLGVGAAVTLAAWSDDEFAAGQFSAGQFSLVGNTASTGLVNHDQANPATLAFETNPDALAPGDVVDEVYYVALGDGTTDDANVTFTATATGDLAPALTPTAALVGAAGDCATATYADASTLNFDLTADPINQQVVCLRVAVTDDQAAVGQGDKATITWQFTATSK
ncbi:MAG: SipW-dependent-type signal peptide-containing protein [Propionibacteriales bacterium]|nr:SipW-dependent-type signal peptide-containing protein [Propionibacteriales bacterium]